MRETIIKKYFFPWAGAKRLRGGGNVSRRGKVSGGGKTSQGGAKSQGGAGQLSQGGGNAPFAPPLSRHCLGQSCKNGVTDHLD